MQSTFIRALSIPTHRGPSPGPLQYISAAQLPRMMLLPQCSQVSPIVTVNRDWASDTNELGPRSIGDTDEDNIPRITALLGPLGTASLVIRVDMIPAPLQINL